MSRNVAASVKDRLRNRTRATGEDFGFLLTRYGCERFLYRLGQSSVRKRFVLKGATLLALWLVEPYRATRDIDMLAFGGSSEESLREAMKAICQVPCPEDGVKFDLGNLRISPISALEEYSGQRIRVTAYLGTSKIQVQVDLGFGDVVTSEIEEDNLPTLLDDIPEPRLRTYPRVTVIAEKLEAMVNLGRGNSRMKDFYDIWAISERFDFDGPNLRKAITGCFERRGTSWTVETPDALRPEFYSQDETLQRYWRSYRGSSGLLEPPPQDFKDIGERIRTFIGPVRESILSDAEFDMYWPAGGHWKPCPSRD